MWRHTFKTNCRLRYQLTPCSALYCCRIRSFTHVDSCYCWVVESCGMVFVVLLDSISIWTGQNMRLDTSPLGCPDRDQWMDLYKVRKNVHWPIYLGVYTGAYKYRWVILNISWLRCNGEDDEKRVVKYLKVKSVYMAVTGCTWHPSSIKRHAWPRNFHIGCVYHRTSGVELRFPNDFQGDFCR